METETITRTLHETIGYYNEVKEQVIRVETNLSGLKKVLKRAEEDVIDALAVTNTDKISVNGQSYSADVKTFVKPVDAAHVDVVVQSLVDAGYATFSPYLHHGKRDAILRELYEEGALPAMLDGLVRVDTVAKLSVRNA